MYVKKIINSYFETNSYIFEYKNSLFIIDPGSDINKIINSLENKKLDYILLTHGHMDHIGSVKELIKLYNPKVYLSILDKDYINGNIILDPYFDKNNYNFKFIDYSNFNIDGIKIINTKGHSKGSVSIYLEKEGIIFTGDTLFKGSFGRYDFPGGNLKELKMSINQLFTLNNKTVIYPGHGEKTTIYDEKIANIIKFYKNL
jgi:glyoxylase-like metal-dependent hydrolase (beta-lactamase superfamily II)